jgi:hypothetical protein
MMTLRQLPANYHGIEYGGITPPSEVLLWPAYSALPFLRQPLGYEIVNPLKALLRAAQILIPWTIIDLWSGRPPNEWLFKYFLVSMMLTAAFWLWRFILQGRPGQPHTTEAGYSWLTWILPVPPWLMEIFAVPGAIGWVGWTVWTGNGRYDQEFGLWLMFVGASLAIMAIWEYRRFAAQQRAINDDMVRAGVYSARVDATWHGASPNPGAGGRGPRKDDRDFADLA